MAEGIISRLPSLVLATAVFLFFYGISAIVARVIRQATRGHRQNIGVVLARLAGATTILLGLLVALSIVAPSFQAADLIKILGIGGVAIGFAFQNILQNFLAGLLLLWSEPFRVEDEIKVDAFEGTVEEIQTRARSSRAGPGRRGREESETARAVVDESFSSAPNAHFLRPSPYSDQPWPRSSRRRAA
jgi:small conductance mechanosensitive channel